MSATEVLAAHRMTRWRSFSNDNEILRCAACRRDFGRLTGKPRRTDPDLQDEWNAHLLDALKDAGYAVVELPEPESIADDFALHGREIRQYAPNGFGAYRPFTLAEAPDLARALLSLVAAAEAGVVA